MIKEIIVFLLVVSIISCVENPDLSKNANVHKIENLKAFAKTYGFIRYFHPSDEASDIDWGYLALYGAQQIEKCNPKSEIVSI